MLVPIVKSSPEIVKSPAIVTSAPLKVRAVVVPDLIIKLPLVFVAEPKVVPPDLKNTSPPAALRSISPEESNVIVVPSTSNVPSAVIVIFAAAASASVVTIVRVPSVPAVNTAVSLAEPVIVMTLPLTATSSAVKDPPVIAPVVVMALAPVSIVPKPLVIDPESSAPTDVTLRVSRTLSK